MLNCNPFLYFCSGGTGISEDNSGHFRYLYTCASNHGNVKSVGIDVSRKDINDVPSEAKEGGDEAKDEENRERMGHPAKSVKTTRNWTN